MEHSVINIKWSTLDVQAKAKDMDVEELSMYEAKIILDKVEKYHDASVGVNWDVIGFYIDDYLASINS